MAVLEKHKHEILMEQLTQHVSKLSAEQKAKEIAIKELNATLAATEIEVAKKTAAMRDECAAHCAALQLTIAPYESLRQTCESLKQDIAKLRQEKLDAIAEIRHARGGAIKAAEELVSKAMARLQQVEMAIDACKTKVAGI